MKVSVFLVLALFYISSSVAQSKFVTEESYREVKLGMSLDETEEIFGVKGVLDTTLIYIWPDNNLQVEWVEGKIVSYSTTSTMLKEGAVNGYEKLKAACKGPDGPMTYNQTYEEVVELLGKEGQEPDWERYLWWVDKYQKIKIVFKEGKVKSKQMF